MLSSFCRTVLSCAAVAGAARVAQEYQNILDIEEFHSLEDILNAEELISAELGNLIEKVEVNQTRPDVGSLILQMLDRQCIQEHAENFHSLMSKYGLNVRSIEQGELLDDVVSFWTLRDMRRNHLSSYNVLTRAIARMRNEQVRSFTQQLQNISNRFQEVGFNYAGAEARCEEDGTSQARACIMEKATQFAAESSASGLPALALVRRELPALVSTRLELRDLEVHEPPAFDKPEFDRLTETIAATGFDLSAAQSECRAVSEQAAAEVVSHLQGQLRNPAPGLDNCNEDPDGLFCPEGTGLMVNRPTETLRGMTAFSTVYFTAWPVLSVVAPALTFAVGMGASPGFIFANILPIPHGAIFGGIAYAIFSTGARTCMCFPEECYYDSSTGSCGLRVADGMAPSNNPFTQTLPFMSTKCVPSHRREETCEMQSCGEADFSPPLGDFEGATYFGKIGQHDGGVYNCISDSGTSGDTLLAKTTLPGSGVENVPANRNRLFQALL